MNACHVRFRGVQATPELLRTIHEREAELQRQLDPGGGCESALLERAADGSVRATLRLRLGAAMDLHVYRHAGDALGAVRAAFDHALRRAQQQSPPSSGIRATGPGLRPATSRSLGNASTA